jgi:hypothetical protein
MNTKLFVFLLALSCSHANAQSTFVFNNRAVSAPVFDSLGQPLSGTDFLAELYGSFTADSLTPTSTYFSQARIGLPFATGTGAGYVPGNNAIMTVWNTPPGNSAWLQLRAWDARLGATYEDVVSLGIGGYGESALFFADGADPTIMQTPAHLIGLQSFSLRPVVPEPSALALLGLGSVSLWFFARRRR